MSYTAKQWRAINWIVKRDSLRPAISAWPKVRLQRPDGTVLEETITTIVDWYDQARKREAKAKAQAKRKQGA
jgi:hypothetical protein